MTGFFLIPFAIFFACCLGQFLLLRRVRQALIARHPDVWLELSGKAFFVDNALYGFAWRRRDRALADPELSRRVDHLRWLYLVAICAWVAMIGLTVTGVGVGRR